MTLLSYSFYSPLQLVLSTLFTKLLKIATWCKDYRNFLSHEKLILKINAQNVIRNEQSW